MNVDIVDVFIDKTARFIIIVGFRITWTLLSCRRELRFPTIKAFRRDAEIAPTENV